jgi:hypothetical protein
MVARRGFTFSSSSLQVCSEVSPPKTMFVVCAVRPSMLLMPAPNSVSISQC